MKTPAGTEVEYDAERNGIVLRYDGMPSAFLSAETVGAITAVWRRRKQLQKNRDVIHQQGGTRK